MFSSFISILISTAVQLFSLIGVIIIVGFILDFFQRKSVQYISHTFGQRLYLLTAWIGTPIHEFGHAIMCVIFGHRIVKVQWFPVKSNVDYFGYVRHTYNDRSLYQKIGNFFIGIGPFFSGILSLIILMYFLVPESYDLFIHYVDEYVQPTGFSVDMVQSAFLTSWVLINSLFTLENVLNPSFWIFFVLAVCISIHIALSLSDIKGAASGLVSLFILLLCLNIVGAFLGFNSSGWVSILASYHAYTIAFSSLAILFSFLTYIICLLFYKISRKAF